MRFSKLDMMSRLCVLAAALSQPLWANTKIEATLVEGRKASKQFLERDSASLWARMTPEMQAVIQSAAGLAQFRTSLDTQIGEEQTILSEEVSEQDGARLYQRTSRWSKAPAPFQIAWAFLPDNRIASFYVRPAQTATVPASPYQTYQTKAALRLPFEGEWLVVWGGRTQAQNYHVVARDQRYAYDLVVVVDGKSHKGDGKSLGDYYAWNQKILSPSIGTVVEVVNDLPDQAIGTSNPQHPAGNYVMIDLGQGEFALLAHMQRGSIKVKLGDKVISGQELGLCGNSGNTSEPHLHFHLQDKAAFGVGEGMPAFIANYRLGEVPVTRGELLKGQLVSPDS